MNNDLQILPNQRISFIQEEFNNLFPYLKLIFYKDKVERKTNSIHIQPLNATLTLQEINKGNKAGKILITGLMAVNDLEKLFEEKFNVQVKILRRSGKSWLETSLTNAWSLDLQNSHGKETSSYTEK